MQFIARHCNSNNNNKKKEQEWTFKKNIYIYLQKKKKILQEILFSLPHYIYTSYDLGAYATKLQ